LKQVILVNEELHLPRGKLAAQVAHAAIGAFLSASPAARAAWLSLGMPKIVLRCDSMAGLVEIEARARAAGLPVMLVQDAGRTVIAEGTITCLGIGPATEDALSPITGELKLVR
jgi:peptidyl-tRNA hydrolase, PTH2 family